MQTWGKEMPLSNLARMLAERVANVSEVHLEPSEHKFAFVQYNFPFQWEFMYIISFYLISMMGFVLDESMALQLLIIIPLSLHAYRFSPLLLILFFPSSIFHIWGSNYQVLYSLGLKFAIFFLIDQRQDRNQTLRHAAWLKFFLLASHFSFRRPGQMALIAAHIGVWVASTASSITCAFHFACFLFTPTSFPFFFFSLPIEDSSPGFFPI